MQNDFFSSGLRVNLRNFGRSKNIIFGKNGYDVTIQTTEREQNDL